MTLICFLAFIYPDSPPAKVHSPAFALNFCNCTSFLFITLRVLLYLKNYTSISQISQIYYKGCRCDYVCTLLVFGLTTSLLMLCEKNPEMTIIGRF